MYDAEGYLAMACSNYHISYEVYLGLVMGQSITFNGSNKADNNYILNQ